MGKCVIPRGKGFSDQVSTLDEGKISYAALCVDCHRKYLRVAQAQGPLSVDKHPPEQSQVTQALAILIWAKQHL
ncbi:hypothetical protein D3C75_1249650 [compost metagenome]